MIKYLVRYIFNLLYIYNVEFMNLYYYYVVFFEKGLDVFVIKLILEQCKRYKLIYKYINIVFISMF